MNSGMRERCLFCGRWMDAEEQALALIQQVIDSDVNAERVELLQEAMRLMSGAKEDVPWQKNNPSKR